MNILDFIILAIMAYGLLAGMYKGSITSGLSAVGFVGAWFGAQQVYDKIANFALSNSTLMAVLNQYLEPESFFENHTQAVTAVSDVIAGGEAALSNAVSSIGKNFGFISDAFSANIRNQAFSALSLKTLADYFDQTLWVAVFNVVAFVVAFAVIYFVINLFVNLLDRVISFPVFRVCDGLIGGVFGLLRASVVVVLVLTIMPMLTSLISPELTAKLTSESALYTFASQFDLLSVGSWIESLILG